MKRLTTMAVALVLTGAAGCIQNGGACEETAWEFYDCIEDACAEGGGSADTQLCACWRQGGTLGATCDCALGMGGADIVSIWTQGCEDAGGAGPTYHWNCEGAVAELYRPQCEEP